MALIVAGYTRHPIPHEEGEWMQVRTRLAPREIAEAAERAQLRGLKLLGSIGVEGMKARDAGQTETEKRQAVERLKADPYGATLDWDWLLPYCVKDWSYRGKPTADNMRLLDVATRDWLTAVIKKAITGPDEEEQAGN